MLWEFSPAPRLSPPATGANAWHTLAYNDRRWLSGKGPVGRGEGAAWATTLPAKKLRAGGTPYYFRGLLCLTAASAAQLNGLATSLTLLARGGSPKATVFINSQQVLASDAVAPAASGYWDVSAAFPSANLFRAGPNIIAVALVVQPGATAIGVDLNLLYAAPAALPDAPTDCPALSAKYYSLFSHQEVAPNKRAGRSSANKLGPGATWRFFDGGSTDLPAPPSDTTSWAGADFAGAAAWTPGPAPLGRGPADGFTWATALPAGTTTGDRGYYYFQTVLCVTQDIINQLPFTDLTLRLLSDDGARVFINGALQHDDVTVTRTPKYWNIRKVVPPAADALNLKPGRNTIAVQVADVPGSPGSGFDLDITYTSGAAFAPGVLTC